MPSRLITPSQLSLFSISPVIGDWWEELQAQKLFDGSKPAVSELDQQLFDDCLRHEQVLLTKLEKEGHNIARLPGRQTDSDYAATREAMAEGVEFIHLASLCNEEMRGSADLLRRIDRPSLLGEWSYIAIECKLFYEGRLQAHPGNCANCITWRTACQSSDSSLYPQQGLVFETVEHSGRSVHAPEEIDRIEQLVDELLGSRYAIARGNRTEEGVLDANTILVTAPYKVQVNRLQQRLHGKARVGTVDKFQGQEAPVAIHSLTASSGDKAPRGVGFLLEPNRLNVAISRAQCLSIVVGSPGLASGVANTVEVAEQINRLCEVISKSLLRMHTHATSRIQKQKTSNFGKHIDKTAKQKDAKESNLTY